MSLSKQEFTDSGRSMLGRAQAGERLTISKLVAGSGTAGQASELWPLTQPKVQELLFNISVKRDYGNGTLLVEGSFKSSDAPRIFLLRELGVMAHIGTEADRLYSISNVFADAPDEVNPASPSIHSFKVKLIIDRIPDAQLVIQIGPTEAVMGENVGADTVGAGVYKEAAGNVLRFKRLVKEAPIDIVETADTITIGTKQLKNNLDLYVPLTYPGITDENVLFPTIQDAHNYLLQFMIPTDKYAKIHVAAGSFTGQMYLWHPNGAQISMEGWPRVDKPVTGNGITFVDAAHKNVVVAGTTEFAVTQPVWIMNGLGWTGGSYVTAKAGNVLTLYHWDVGGRNPYNVPNGSAGCRVSWNPTVLISPHQAPWSGDEILCACNYGAISNMTFLGGYRALALSGDRCALSNIYCLLAQVGIACGPLVVLAGSSDVIVSKCSFGLSIGTQLNGSSPAPPSNRSVDFCANGCDCGIAVGGNGGIGAIPGVGSATGVVYLIGNGSGVRNWGNALSVGNALYANNDVGFDAAYCGTIIFGPFANTPYNNRLDLWAHGMGYIEYYKGSGAEPVCDPVKNATGNQNAYIHV